MSTAIRVALIGFSKFERATFESFFRLATRRTPAYALAEDIASCEVAIANADDAAGVAELKRQGKLNRTLALGSTPCAGAAQLLPRPINLMLVVRALDALVQSRPEVSPAVQRVLDDLATVTASIPAGVDTRALAAQAQAAAAPASQTYADTMPAPLEPDALALLQPGHGQHWAGAPRLDSLVAPPAPAPPAPQAKAADAERPGMDHILVVDDSDIALRFMAQQLHRFGFQVHLVRSGAEAIERVSRRHFEFVFLDVMMEGMDGFQTCKQIKRSTYPDNRPPPTVVMLTSRGTAVDKLRGTMAGADTYLIKPLNEDDLLKVIGDREVAMHAYKETAAAANTLI